MWYNVQPRWSRRWLILPAVLLAVATVPGCKTSGEKVPRSERTGEVNVRPGINDNFKQDNVDQWVDRFEGESREVYAGRRRIVEIVNPRPGMRIADVGAGTGFFAELFAEKVGPSGKVYAVDIAPAFIELIRTRIEEDDLDNVVPVLCTEDSVELPPQSIDVAFICDTYHHFEYPHSTMSTIHEALVPGGEVVVVDFKRIPGESREWVMNHVRAGQNEFIEEIESVGFELIERGDDLDFLDENYVMRFRKRS